MPPGITLACASAVRWLLAMVFVGCSNETFRQTENVRRSENCSIRRPLSVLVLGGELGESEPSGNKTLSKKRKKTKEGKRKKKKRAQSG